MEASVWGLLLNSSRGGGYALWENCVHQQQFSLIKANVRSHVHLSLLGISCTFHLMVLKTDNVDWEKKKKDCSFLYDPQMCK